MKINNNIRKNSKLLKLKLIQSKTLKKKHFLKNITLEDIEYRLKKALYIIYLFHIQKKKILFVGNPLNIYGKIKKLLKKTRHVFIPKKAWIAGTITNQKKSSKLVLKKKSDLVVIIDKEVDMPALEESYKSKIIVISLNSDLNPFETLSNYKVPGNFVLSKNKFKNNFFYAILFSILKKANKVKKHLPQIASLHQLKARSIFTKLKKKKKYYKKKKNDYKKKNSI